jgi:hypothetical protein
MLLRWTKNQKKIVDHNRGIHRAGKHLRRRNNGTIPREEARILS